jgi:DeoR family galactitol utilization operon repressor
MLLDLNDRDKAILELLSDRSFISVSELAHALGVSEVTVRGDLSSLEERGYLVRVRGGAAPSMHRSILEHQKLHMEEKQRIAKKAAELVRDGDRIMIEAGTTTALISRYLVGKQDVQIVTNSMLAFSYSRTNPFINLILTGGTFRRETESLVGPIAVQSLASFNARLAFVGTDGFSLQRGMTTQLTEGAEIVRAMSKLAEVTWLIADSSKFDKVGFVSVLPLKAVHGIISDTGLSKEAVEALKAEGLEVLLA